MLRGRPFFFFFWGGGGGGGGGGVRVLIDVEVDKEMMSLGQFEVQFWRDR